MLSGTTIAVVTVLVIVIGIFFLLVARRPAPFPPSPPAPPDPAVKGLVLSLQQSTQALRQAVAGVAVQEQRLEAAVVAAYNAHLPSGPVDKEGVKCGQLSDCAAKGQSPAPGVTCTNGWCMAPVSPEGPLRVKSRVQDAGAQLRSALQTYGVAVENYYKKIGEWDASTPFPAFLGLQTDTQALAAGEVGKLENAIGGTLGALGALHDSWVDAFKNAYLSVDSDKTVGPAVKTMADTLASFQRLSSTSGSPSPLQLAADGVRDSYRLLTDHFLKPDIPGVPRQ